MILSFISISVIIPCFNGARYLRETLESVMRQTYPVHEVIVVDDGSTDDSAAIAESFGPPVRVIRQTNQGESVARNRGIDEAKGDWIALLDADDLWEPQKLERQAAVVAENPNGLACVYSDFYKFFEGGKDFTASPKDNHGEPNARIRLLLDWWCVLPSTALIQRDVCLNVRFSESVRLGEDVIFFAMIYDYGRIHRVAEFLTGYRQSLRQQTKSDNYWIQYVREKCAWFEKNNSNYSIEERHYFYNWIHREIEWRHDNAVWRRMHNDVRDYRALYGDLFGGTETAPASFRKRLYPERLCRIKDWIDGFISGKSRRAIEPASTRALTADCAATQPSSGP